MFTEWKLLYKMQHWDIVDCLNFVLRYLIESATDRFHCHHLHCADRETEAQKGRFVAGHPAHQHRVRTGKASISRGLIPTHTHVHGGTPPSELLTVPSPLPTS